MTVRQPASNVPGGSKSNEEDTLCRLAESLSPQQWSWLNALDPNFLFSALQSLHSPPGETSESRGAVRRRVVLGAKIIFNGRMSVVDCQISDISATGCKLKVQSSAHIPNRFTLVFNASNISRECEIAWRNENAMGVLFLSDHPAG